MLQDVGVEVDEVGEVFEDVGGQVAVLLLLLALVVVLPFLTNHTLTLRRFSFSFANDRFDFAVLALGSLGGAVTTV